MLKSTRKSFLPTTLATVIVLGLGFSSQFVYAATVTSVGTGDWSAGATWNTGAEPAAADDVVLADTFTVTVDAAAANATAIASLTVGGGTATLQADNPVTTTGVIDLATFQLDITGAGTVTAGTNLDLNGGTLNGDVTVTGNVIDTATGGSAATGTITLTNAANHTISATAVNNLTFSPAAAQTLTLPAALAVGGTATLTGAAAATPLTLTGTAWTLTMATANINNVCIEDGTAAGGAAPVTVADGEHDGGDCNVAAPGFQAWVCTASTVTCGTTTPTTGTVPALNKWEGSSTDSVPYKANQ